MKLNLIYFSPTGTTQTVVKEIAKNLAFETVSDINITKLKADFEPIICTESLTIIGAPVYGGRLPKETVEILSKLQAKNSLAVVVVVYGNRHYDDALLELSDIAKVCGFKVIAAAAFIGEHSFSTIEKPIAAGRPDAQDLQKCREFAQQIQRKLHVGDFSEPFIPGNKPYRDLPQHPLTLFPQTDTTKCNICGKCAEVCPTNAITINEKVETDGKRCIWCCACVKSCPTSGRIFDNLALRAIQDRLFANCAKRREAEFFM